MKKNTNVFSIPNILTLCRILLIPVIVISFFRDKIYLTALLILLSGLTDVVDGFIARKFNMITPLGKVIDPIADKLTLFSLLTCVCLKNIMVLSLLIIFVIKELLMGVEGVFIIKQTGAPYSAKWYGKITTFLMYLSLLIMILWENITFSGTIILICVCVIFVVISFVLYTIKNLKKLNVIKE